MSILLFPKDIISLLINDYFDGKAAFSCFLVCKFFNRCIKRDIIIKKYLKYLIYQENKDYIENIIDCMCPICHQIMQRKEHLKKHLKKHNNSKRSFPINKKIPPTCEHCEIPFIGNIKGHEKHCKMRRTHCQSRSIIYYPEIESACTKPEGYLIEMHNHTCGIRCIECKKEFHYYNYVNHSYQNTVSEHIAECPNRMDMISKYGIYKRKVTIVDKITYKTYVCHNCEKERDECQCICQECGKNNANTFFRNGIIQCICVKCAKCEKCNSNWKESNINKRTWKYEQPPYCSNCVN